MTTYIVTGSCNFEAIVEAKNLQQTKKKAKEWQADFDYTDLEIEMVDKEDC